MNKILVGAIALSLLGGSVAMAQPDNHDQGRQAADQRSADQRSQDQRNQDWRNQDQHRGDRDGGYHGYRSRDDHRGRLVCQWRHHHKVCYRRHWR